MKKLTIRLSEDEYMKMNENKESLSFRKINEFFKSAVLNQKTYKNIFREFLMEFGKQGNNINQIAYKLNSGAITEKEILENFEIIQKQQKQILDYVSKQLN